MACLSSPNSNDVLPIEGWVPPKEGQLKLNFDGSSCGNPSPTGFGFVVRDDQGKLMFAVCVPLGICDSTQANLVSLLKGLLMLRLRGVRNCMVEEDSFTVISWAKGDAMGSWKLLHFLREVMHLVLELWAELVHIPHINNEVADSLPKAGVGMDLDFVGDSIPDCM